MSQHRRNLGYDVWLSVTFTDYELIGNAMKHLVLIAMLAPLGGLLIFQANRIIDLTSRLERSQALDDQLNLYMKQQMWLYDAAGKAPQHDPLLAEAEERLKTMQQRYSASALVDSNSVSVVDVPAVQMAELQTYAWQVFIPKESEFALIGFYGGEEPAPEVQQALKFNAPLPTGESRIELKFRGTYDGTWGNSLAADEQIERHKVFVQLCINENEVWSETYNDDLRQYERRQRFNEPTVVQPSDQAIELVHKGPVHLQLVQQATKDGSQ